MFFNNWLIGALSSLNNAPQLVPGINNCSDRDLGPVYLCAECTLISGDLSGNMCGSISARKHPCKDCLVEFKNHLHNLSKLPLYGGAKTVEQVLADRAMAASQAETLGPGRGNVGSVVVGLEEEEEVDLEPETEAAEAKATGEVEVVATQATV